MTDGLPKERLFRYSVAFCFSDVYPFIIYKKFTIYIYKVVIIQYVR